MTEIEMSEKIAVHEQEINGLNHRVDKLERNTEALNKLASSMEVFSYKQDALMEKVDCLSGKVESIEKEPGENWKKIIGYVVAALCSAGVGALITFLFH